MKTILLLVNRAETDEGVALVTAYHGVKTDNAGALYDRVAVVQADSLWLNMAWDECCAKADLMLAEYLATSSFTTTGYQASLHMPDNWDERWATSLETHLRSLFIAWITAKWMAVTMPEQENHYAAKASGLAEGCMKIIHSRKRPNPIPPPFRIG